MVNKMKTLIIIISLVAFPASSLAYSIPMSSNGMQENFDVQESSSTYHCAMTFCHEVHPIISVKIKAHA